MTSCRPSLHALLAILFLALVTIIEARPSKSSLTSRNAPHGPPGLSGYNVPVSDGSQSLPTPTSTLKAIAIGRGTQNYTCTTTNTLSSSVPTPVAIGAMADLLDASPLLTLVPPQEGISILSLLPEYLVNFDTDLITEYPIPLLGHHYFNSAGQPTFDLGTTGFLTAKKTGDIPAPAGAYPGSGGQGFGAVDWLSLVDAGGSTGVHGVYRVDTAGGKAPPTCAGQDQNIEVQYSALYWFYE